ncbi:MAG: hypothetical protein ACP5H2_00595 [Solirubrobacteraceae bacterium]
MTWRGRHTFRLLTGTVALLGTAATVAGCGSSSPANPRHPSTQASKPSTALPATLIHAADLSAAAVGYRLAMTVQETASGEHIHVTANGSFQRRPATASMQMHARIPSTLGTASYDVKVLLANGSIYLKAPSSLASDVPTLKPWLSIRLAQTGKLASVPVLGTLASGASSLTDPGQYLYYLRATANGSVKNLGTQQLDGAPATHYVATIDVSKLPDAVPASQRAAVRQLVASLHSADASAQEPVNVWIDSTHMVRRLEISTHETVAGKPVSMVLNENFESYGPQPAPVLPSPGETTNVVSLLSLLGSSGSAST